MPVLPRIAATLGAAAATAAVLTGCTATAKTTGPTPTTPAASATARTDPATDARATELAQLKTQMIQAMHAAGLTGSAIEDIHPKETLNGTPDCLASYLLQNTPAARTAAVTTALTHAMTRAGWTTDPNSAAGTTTLEHGDWTITISSQASGTDVSPATGKIRTGPLTFFQAKNNTFDCN